MEVARRPDSFGRLSDTEIFEWICVEYVGITVEEGIALKASAKK